MFRFYITDLHQGQINGTNSEEDAQSYAESEDYFVVDTNDGTWLLPGAERVKIQLTKNY